ncbi:MAG TPA: MraY family glycosyltransferase [Aggregatilineaceae bacterium]|jgi:UDP-GlcNAc:undecaprenyl-phosphate GlcNAc-1-phosphate transferase|nr:undecaprenyl/decaprenyl-phosphate alpha-N-acetylglucosaminyl 1-phosphate transferase [Anaerolineae bacterium]HMM27022.1 MraY family glycosyltransferase [Aggregatilineaceae bacterium]
MSDVPAGHLLSFAIVLGLSFGLSFLLTPLAQRLGVRLGIVDVPRDRHLHPRVTSKFGGLAMFVAFVVAVVVAQFLPVERTDEKEIIRLIGLLLGGTFIWLFGILDDRRNFGPLPQYAAQLVAAAIAVAFLIFIEQFNNPLTGQRTPEWPYVVTITISLFWLGLMMNTVNWLDGLDGLAAGVCAVASLMIFLHAAFELNQTSVSLLPLALLGATLGFLPFNFHPARVFMGSNGALFLGFTVGVLSIIGGAKMATVLLVMGLPLVDVAWQIVRRARSGGNPVYGDRGHVHYRLLDAGFSQRQIVLGYYLFCALFGGIALVTASRVFKLIALIVMAAVVALGVFLVSRRAPRTPDAAPPD